MLAVIDDVAARLAPDDRRSARVRTLSVFAMMIGTLQLSRALADRHLADQILEQGIRNALALLGVDQSNLTASGGPKRPFRPVAGMS